MSKQHKLHVLVCSFNRPKKLYHLLKTAQELNIEALHFVVFDDGSTVLEEVAGLGLLSTEEVAQQFSTSFITFLKNPVNQGFAACFEQYCTHHCHADYLMLMRDKDTIIDRAPIIQALDQMEANKDINLFMIPMLQKINDTENQLLTFNYPLMGGKAFIKQYVLDNTLQHCIISSIVRTSALREANVPQSLHLNQYDLIDAFGIDLHFFLKIAATNKVAYGNKPHVLGDYTGGLTEKYPLTFAYCYYQYAKKTMMAFKKEAHISDNIFKTSMAWWLLLITRGLINVYRSPSSEEKNTNKLKKHLKWPVTFYILKECLAHRVRPCAEMKSLLLDYHFPFHYPRLAKAYRFIKKLFSFSAKAFKRVNS